MLAVYKRELQGFFLSPIGYVFMGFFLVVTGVLFATINVFSQSASYSAMMESLTFVFLLAVPILTMRLLSEDRKNKTDQLLLTSPVSIFSVVMGKYLAAVTVFFLTLVVSFIYPIVLFAFGSPSFVEILTGYIGFFLLGCALIAVGLFISGLSENQVTSAIASFGIMLMLYVGGVGVVGQVVGIQWINTVLGWFSVFDRFTKFSQGLLNLPAIVYYISFAAVFLFMTTRTIERRRWSEV